MSYFWVAIGGSLGAIFRFSLGNLINNLQSKSSIFSFPYSTLSINFIGSFLIGIVYIVLLKQEGISDLYRQLLMIGFLGSFTTFSTFSLDSIVLMQEARWGASLSYIALSLLSCICATYIGMMLTKYIYS
jgi:CrcB protein